jgi:hypothetical protein
VSLVFLLVAAGTLTFFWLFFMLLDYSWEDKKLRGLDPSVRPIALGSSSERAEYRRYSWVRYLTIVTLTYINTLVLTVSRVRGEENSARVLGATALILLVATVLHAVDSFWDRKRRRGLRRIEAGIFWSYFWLRYPALILATVTAGKWAIQQ